MTINTGDYEHVKDVVADRSTNDVYIIGQWENDLSAVFPGGVNPSQDFTNPYGAIDGFVAKYDSAGTFLWAFKVGGSSDDNIRSIAIDPDGNIFITGYFGTGTSYFSGTSPHIGPSKVDNTSGEDFYIAKYNPNGEFLWIKRSETNSGDLAGLDIYATSSAVFATGRSDVLATFGALSISNIPIQDDIFLIKYNVDGDEQWVAQSGSNGNDYAYGVVADGTNVYYTGSFDGSNLNLRNTAGGNAGSLVNANNGTEEILLVSYNVDGTYNWSQIISSSGEDEAFDITMDADSLYISGGLNDVATFPGYAGNPVSTTSNRDIFFSSHAKTNGKTGWVSSLPCTDPGNEWGRSIDTDGNGVIYMSGDFKQDLSFPDDVSLTAEGAEDVFVASYTTNGTFRWALSAGSASVEYGYGISAGFDGTIYVGGLYTDLMTLGTKTLPDDALDNGYFARLSDVCTNAIGGTVTTSSTEVCEASGATLHLAGYSGTITWQQSPSGMETWSDIPGENMDTVFVSPLMDIDYRAYLISGTCNPDSSNVVSVLVYKIPIADPGPGGETCGNMIELHALPSVGIGQWSKTSGPGSVVFNPSVNDPIVIVTVTQFGTYEFTWTEINGVCSDTSSVSVSFIEMIDANAGVDGNVCGLTFKLNAVPANGSGFWTKASGPGNIIFAPSDTLFNASATVDQFGTYEFLWNVSQGNCNGIDTVEVNFFNQPNADAGPDQVLEFVFSTRHKANTPEFGTGRWTLLRGSGQLEDENDPASEITGLSLGENELIWSIVTGVCEEVSDNVVITVQDIFAPTVITPNNDGFNDFLVFPGIDLQAGSELILYNRWGTEVFRSVDYQNDWSGKDHKGRDLISDTYFYVIKLPSSRIIKSFVEIRR
ncbi:MAG: gliding motility-associated C-terminal domain-containing protein [Bacteroidales bacterium]|nr:gliding motility-associated C-terminal domain-containing protein [Bacteroidales bacterium]